MQRRSATTLALALSLLALAPALAKPRGDDADRASKNGHLEGTAGGVQVIVEYGRPKVNGREIWGGLVPYGEVWRTGANEATTVTFDRDVEVEGKKLAAGRYALFTIPAAEGPWTAVFNRVADQWGAFKYDAAQDALRVEATPRAHEPVEEMTFAIEGDALVLRWAKLELPIRLHAAG